MLLYIKPDWNGIRCCIAASVIVVIVTLLGNVIFSALEADNETESRASYTKDMLDFKTRANLSEEDFEWIVGQVQAAKNLHKRPTQPHARSFGGIRIANTYISYCAALEFLGLCGICMGLQIGTEIEFDPEGSTRNWGTWNTNSALFSFTIGRQQHHYTTLCAHCMLFKISTCSGILRQYQPSATETLRLRRTAARSS